MNKDLLTVLVITYNHAKYFEKCLDSILAQKTDFAFKIHICDDKSTDGTTELVKRYAAQYPDKITAFIREPNLGVVGNIYEAIKSVDTEYFAFIESDDFWTDTTKLQQQVDILRNNPDCSFCGHNTINNFPEDPSNPLNGKKFFKAKEGKYSFPKTYKKKYFLKVHPSSRVFRTSCLELDKVKNIEVVVWDSCNWWWFLSKGKLYYIDKVMSAYNRTDTGIFSGATKEKQAKLSIRNILSINKEFNYQHNNIFVEILKRKKFINFVDYIKLKHLTKAKNIEQEYCKVLKKYIDLRLYTSVAANNLGDMLNYYLLEHYHKMYLRAYIEDANLVAIGSVLDKLYSKSRGDYDISQEVRVLGSGFISDFKTYKSAKSKTRHEFSRKLNILALRGNVSKKRCEEELGEKLDIPLGDPGLLANRLIDSNSITKQYDVGIIPHYADKGVEHLKNINLHKYNFKIIDISGDTINTLKEIASCKVVLSSAMHGLIAADSFGIPNKWLKLSDNVFGGDYKFTDYYSVFNISNPKPLDLANSKLTDDEVDNIIKNYKISPTKVEEICDKLEEIYKGLK